jgi:hypothetical protein
MILITNSKLNGSLLQAKKNITLIKTKTFLCDNLISDLFCENSSKVNNAKR